MQPKLHLKTCESDIPTSLKSDLNSCSLIEKVNEFFQVDGMGVILKEVKAKLDPKIDAKFRAHGYRGSSWLPSIVYWPVFYFY
ncbi:MAG: hypothetical protein JSW11_11310 [Candidatus Heimdallarchaeota archaeon]|nr:MAG: hypothetical protein JSW11_11310 [Candidatus Heimdallarchaeota archaeon]